MISNINRSNCIYELNYDFDTERLLKEFNESDLATFSSYNETWERSGKLGEYSQNIIDIFDDMIDGRVIGLFYNQPAGTAVKLHRDMNCKSKINIILSHGGSTLMMGGHEIKYETALLNVHEVEHSVTVAPFNRSMLSVVFMENGFHEVKEKITNG